MEWNAVEIAKKLGLAVAAAILVALSLPGHAALANGTMVEVNSGKTITLNTGMSLSNIPLDVRGISVSGNATGLAAFDFTLGWDPAVIRVETVSRSTAAANQGWAFTIGAINNTLGRVSFVGTTTQQPYSKADITLAYLGITAVGSLGKTTAITVTITNLVNNMREEIEPRSAVNAPVEIGLGTLRAIVITPAAPSIAPDETQQFRAVGTYTFGTADITNSVTWGNLNPDVVTINAAGLATGLAAGTATVTATLSTVGGATTLTVTGAKVEEAVEPSAKKEEVVGSPKTEPATTNVSASTGDKDASAERTAPKSEDSKVKPAANQGAAAAGASLPPQPVNWWLVGGIVAGAAVIGVVIWLALRRRPAKT